MLDQTGLAQKGGAVTCHLRIAKSPDDIHAVRIAAGEADLVLGCDMVVVNDYWALSKIRADRSHVVLNTLRGDAGHVHDASRTCSSRRAASSPRCRPRSTARSPKLVDATELATALLGDSIASNLFMLGYAWQKGWVPVSLDALMRAVELNARRGRDEQDRVQLGPHGRARPRHGARGGRPAESAPASGAIPLALPTRRAVANQAATAMPRHSTTSVSARRSTNRSRVASRS